MKYIALLALAALSLSACTENQPFIRFSLFFCSLCRTPKPICFGVLLDLLQLIQPMKRLYPA